MKKDIASREDVYLVVSTFYSQVRKNSFIGNYFNETITDWDEHLEKLTDFWETNLFYKAKYKGNPMRVHGEVDQKFGGEITSEHFGEWLNLWVQTIDSLFEGELANRAKNNAAKMATHLFMNIYQNRTL
jgi:hemoglobin